MSEYSYDLKEFNGEKVVEAYRFPAAVDLFIRCGAKSGSEVAAEFGHGGYGAVAVLPDGKSGSDETGEGSADILNLACAMQDDGSMAEIGLLRRKGIKLFCVPKEHDSLHRLRSLMCYASDFDCRIVVSPFSQDLVAQGYMNDSPAADRLGIKSVPKCAEIIGALSVIELAREWQTPLHLRGISCFESVAIVERARRHGVDVTCNVPFMNLLHTDEEYTVENLTSKMKVWPVLRGAEDRKALWEGIESGIIKAVTSNYMARSTDEASLSFEEIPFGCECSENVIPELFRTREEFKDVCSVDKLIEALSKGPREILREDLAGFTVVCKTGDGKWHSYLDI